MENLENGNQAPEQTEAQEKYFSKIEQIESEYVGKRLFPIGEVKEVGWSNLGKVMSVTLSGDVPTNFQQMNIVIVHPDSDSPGWIGLGGIGVTMEGNGTSISSIPLPQETVNIIRDIYTKYVGKGPDGYQSFNIKDNGSDVTQYAVPGLYNDILAQKNK